MNQTKETEKRWVVRWLLVSGELEAQDFGTKEEAEEFIELWDVVNVVSVQEEDIPKLELAECFWWESDQATKQVLEHQAFMSYPPDSSYRKTCNKCGRILKYNSISYHEGFHIDSCE